MARLLLVLPPSMILLAASLNFIPQPETPPPIATLPFSLLADVDTGVDTDVVVPRCAGVGMHAAKPIIMIIIVVVVIMIIVVVVVA
mmetsp:Transcript_30205/g.59170  ORF Transcript_30205/g.59170 Transcript_30205/m.59170 type:complete len:86 (-) Transcript_30205:102-359(-)